MVIHRSYGISLSLSLSLSVVDKAPPLCKKLSFKCVFVVRSSDGIKWNILRVLLLVVYACQLLLVIRKRNRFSRMKNWIFVCKEYFREKYCSINNDLSHGTFSEYSIMIVWKTIIHCAPLQNKFLLMWVCHAILILLYKLQYYKLYSFYQFISNCTTDNYLFICEYEIWNCK